MPRYRDLVGQVFTRLTVVSYAGTYKHGGALWNVRCDCGSEKQVAAMHLMSGHAKSCGCLQTEVATIHGMTNTTTFRAWSSMLNRCRNPNNQAYPRYGGRGITVCERWNSFENFYADMGEQPKGLSLERRDNDQGYGPDNCCWATRIEQNNNKRTNRLVTSFGKTQTVAQWSREIGITASALRHRLNNGWTVERALNQ